MNLNSVEMFVHAVISGSLSAAALSSGIPLATLSRHIKELERDLDTQLLERSSQGIQLTEAGANLYEHASQGLEWMAKARQAVVVNHLELRGKLRLSLPPVFEPWWELISAFQNDYPFVKVSVLTTERRVNLTEDGIDVALRVGAIVHEMMIARHQITYRHLLVASPVLLKRFDVPTRPADLNRYPCGMWGHGSGLNNIWHLGEESFVTDPILTTNDYLHLRSQALRGDLVTELPPFLASQGLMNKSLVHVLPDYPLPEQEVNLLYPSRHPSTIVRTYIDFCSRYISNLNFTPQKTGD
ncbi:MULTISPECIES: LysR family transcriptional regulator [unclassified Pseudomonas]|uniref:LysR family transcriptional regulator n=1 Tax=unclassified Pseudomonas TaxID=196821 RepID=UPI001C572DFA|nr:MULTISPECIES: LysR family transcriptional regulator [unclassified Pseudomonas]MDI1329532.1 LysR family transcriptional regulator [Pseudomonas sp.]